MKLLKKKNELKFEHRLIERKAKEMNKSVNIESIVCKEAFEALIKGDKEEHNQILLETATQIANKVEIIVLAQGSMTALAPVLENKTGLKVLTCPESGIKAAGEILIEKI